MSRVPDFTFRRSRPCLRAMSRRVITAMSPNPGLSAIHNEKMVTARYAGSLRNRNTPAILNPPVTVSVPVDSNNYWYGVLGMSIPVRTMQQFLRNAIDKNLDGEYQLYDSKLEIFDLFQS